MRRAHDFRRAASQGLSGRGGSDGSSSGGSQDMTVFGTIPQRPEGPLEPMCVFPSEAVEELVKDSVEGSPLGATGAVEFRRGREGERRFHARRLGKGRARSGTG